MSDGPFPRSELAGWMTPVSVSLTDDQLAALAAVVADLAHELSGNELDAVKAAFGVLSDAAREWAMTRLEARAPMQAAGNPTELIKILLGAAVATSIGGDDPNISCALAIASAAFAGKHSLIADLPVRANRLIVRLGRTARDREEIPDSAASSAIGELAEVPMANPDEEVAAPELSAVADDVLLQGDAIRSLASSVDTTIETVRRRQESLEEEIEVLWWALRETNAEGTPFSEMPPARRAVSAAAELAMRTSTVPGPPSASYLLRRVLGDQSSESTSVADLAGAAALELETGAPTADFLFPVLASADKARELGTGDDTWKTVLERSHGIDTKASATLTAGAEQVYRELLLVRSLEI